MSKAQDEKIKKYQTKESYEKITGWKPPIDNKTLSDSMDGVLDEVDAIDGLDAATADKRLAAIAVGIAYSVEKAMTARDATVQITGGSGDSEKDQVLINYVNKVITGEIAWLVKKYASGEPIFK